jgi:hypothetical protein
MRSFWPAVGILAAVVFSRLALAATGPELDSETQQQLQELRQQNQAFQEQLRKQQQLIEELSRKVATLQTTTAEPKPPANDSAPNNPAPMSGFESALSKVHLSGEGAVGLFESQSHGAFPNNEFRVDEAKLFAEAPIWDQVYFFTELNLFLREDPNFNLRAGELYLDVEDVSRLWGRDGQLNLRAGRMDIPFGEEYLRRDAIDNPLISHSIMDFWGVDEGIELYGSLNRFHYIVAVQNGGDDPLRDFTGDKAVIARLGWDPTRWLHTSVSAMRTGTLDVNQDRVSALWLGSGFVHSIGSTNTTLFQANLLQGDLQLKLANTTVRAWGGVLQYKDNDPVSNNSRDVYYYSLEATQKLYKGLYAAARWSQAFAHHGFPLIGNGNVDEYFARELTRDLSLLSVGLGYRWSPQLVLKMEYSFERGHEADGTPRNHEDLFALMAAFAF